MHPFGPVHDSTLALAHDRTHRALISLDSSFIDAMLRECEDAKYRRGDFQFPCTTDKTLKDL